MSNQNTQKNWKDRYAFEYEDIVHLSSQELRQKSAMHIEDYIQRIDAYIQEKQAEVKKYNTLRNICAIMLIFIACLFVGMVLFILPSAIEYGFEDWEGISIIMMLVCALIPLIVLPIMKKSFKKTTRPFEEEIAEVSVAKKRLVTARKEQNELFKNQKNFPKELFYELCANEGIKEIKGEFSTKKAQLIQQEIANFMLPPAFRKTFLSHDIAVLFEEGQTEHLENTNRWNATPHRGNPTETEAQIIKEANEVQALKGLQKRKHILTSNINKSKIEIRKKKEAEEAALQLAVMLNNSTSTPKGDWAFLGGIADGIAGPGAGAAVALSVMAENERIAANNRAMASGAISALQDSRMKTSASRYDLERAVTLLEGELSALNQKIVLTKFTKEEVLKNLDILDTNVEKQENNVLRIRVKLKNKMPSSEVEGAHIVVDGTYKATIKCGETLVGETTIALPIYGVECEKIETITGYCPMYMEGDRKYTVTLEPNNLWLMEL